MIAWFAWFACTEWVAGSGQVTQVSASCGRVQFEVLREGGLSSTLPILVDGVEVDTVEAALQVPTPVELELVGAHEVRAGMGPPVRVDVPPSDLKVLGSVPVIAPMEGEPVRVPVQVLGSCRQGPMKVRAVVASTGAAVEAAVSEQGAGIVELGTLGQGRHDVTLEALTDAGEVRAQAEVAVRVDPPCQNAACRDRDDDGHDNFAVGGDDCNDADPFVFPGAVAFPDEDGDGASPVRRVDIDCDGVEETYGSFDCDDADPSIPRPEEPMPTGVDEDCDGLVDEGTVAFDDDGDGLSEEEGDCNDGDPSVHPGANEGPDCKDNDCDGSVDEGLTRSADEDAYEPNDVEVHALAGAQPRRGPFGGYKPTEDLLQLRVRGLRDVERFSLFTHDGSGDSYHVTAQLVSAGDGLQYRVRLESDWVAHEEVLGAGSSLRLGGRPMKDDSGTVQLVIEPVGEVPQHCPLLVKLTSG